MFLNEELYFEITLEGLKSELKRFVKFLKSGELDDFFEIPSDYIVPDDGYSACADDEETSVVFTNDEIGVEVSDFAPEEFLDVFCKAARALDVTGHFYDINDEEYSFTSAAGSDSYQHGDEFCDELDEEAYKEEKDED